MQKLRRPAHRRFSLAKKLMHWHWRCVVPRMLDWRRAANLLGETVREMGVLILVFAPLEAIFTDVLVSNILVAAMFLVGVLLAAGGIM